AQVHLDHEVARVELLALDLLLAAAHLGDGLDRHDDLRDLVLEAGLLDPQQHVGADLVLAPDLHAQEVPVESHAQLAPSRRWIPMVRIRSVVNRKASSTMTVTATAIVPAEVSLAVDQVTLRSSSTVSMSRSATFGLLSQR